MVAATIHMTNTREEIAKLLTLRRPIY